MEIPLGTKVGLGRRAAPHLNNLHISREQVVIELKTDVTGRILICMTNVRRGDWVLRLFARPPGLHANPTLQRGKNSTRVLSVNRRKQARVASDTYCRLVPGDIIELLYDQQGQYAYKVRMSTPAPQ